jgi:hypothetical protein
VLEFHAEFRRCRGRRGGLDFEGEEWANSLNGVVWLEGCGLEFEHRDLEIWRVCWRFSRRE